MLRVTVELVPQGDEDRANVIGEMIIANDGSGTLDRGNYKAVMAPDDFINEKLNHMNIQNFDRSMGVWDLISILLGVRQDGELPGDSLYKRMVKRFKMEVL